MRKTKSRKVLSVLLAAALVASSVPMTALAGDTLPYVGESAKGKNQPYQHGYRAEDLLSWSPETDPYAPYLKAEVPLQNRNAAFAATQANPNLSSVPEYFTLAGDYGNAFFDSYPYTNEFSQHVFNFWQYVDYYGSWHGMPTEEVPESLYNAEGERNGTADWTQRTFEFGMMNLPNPGYTNAAHKNGALSIGCIFQPRAYQHYDILLTQDEDGNFPYAQKLVEICEYYGFDGWFFNMEGRGISDPELLGQFLGQMREAGLYIQWYTADGSFGDGTATFLTSAQKGETDKEGDRAQSVFLDYGWPSSISGSVNTAASFGLDPIKAVFGGVEAGRDRWGCDTRYFNRTLNSDGDMIVSIASLGTDFVQSGLDDDMGGGFRREQDNYQWMAFQRERLWWTGGANEVLNPGLTGEDIGASKTNFKGVSNFIAERSVINGDTFVTNFNTGHGLEYLLGGEVSSDKEWSNIGIQDILPTWQWWFETEGTKLNAEFDYGANYQKTLKSGTDSSFDFDLVGAYNGGSSLAVYGAMDAKNFMHLYKTDLDVTANSKMDITFKKTSQDDVTMKLGIIFEDDTSNVVELDIADSAAKSDAWVTSTVDLSAYAGKQIAAIGLVFDGTSADYQINVGQMAYTSKEAQKPAAPTGLKIDQAYETGEVKIRWDIASYDDVKQYNIYKIQDGKEVYLGGAYDDAFYIKDIGGTDAAVTIAVKAVSADGTESDAATVAHDYTKAVKDVKVTAEDGKLNVTWTGGQADVTVTTTCEAEPRTWTASGENAAEIIVPTGKDADGARYTMRIKTADGTETSYDGRLDDSYSEPYDGKMIGHKLTNPLSKDWYKLHLEYTTTAGSSKSDVYIRGTNTHGDLNNDWSVFHGLPDDIQTLQIILEDYSGNQSEPVNYTFKDGEPIDLEKVFTAEEIPDATLRYAIMAQAGRTVGEALNYTGKLDLSTLNIQDYTGLKYVSGITELDISNTQIADLTPLAALNKLQILTAVNTQIETIGTGVLPVSLETIDLSNNGKLTAIEEGAVAALTNLSFLKLSGNTALTTVYLNDTKADLSLDLSGCTGVQKLYLTGTEMTSFDISEFTGLTHFYGDNSSLDTLTYDDASAYTSIYCFDIRGSKFDLSNGTPERDLIAAMEAYLEEHPVTPELGDRTNVALGKTVEAGATIRNANNLFEGRTSYFNSSIGELTLKYEEQIPIYGWKMINDTYNGYGFADYEVQYSVDGNTWNTLGQAVAGSNNRSESQEWEEPVMASYIKLIVTKTQSRGADVIAFEVYGCLFAPSGIKSGDQRPAAYYGDLPESVTVLQNGAELRTKNYFEDTYTEATTVRGNKFADLEGADWIAADYDIAGQIAVPGKVYVQITDKDGDIINEPEQPDTPAVDTETNMALNANILNYSGQVYSEPASNLFDGTVENNSKWCVNGNTGWVAFTVPEEISVGQWITKHAGAGGEDTIYNTRSFELQILNTDAIGMSEEDFLNSSDATNRTILSNDANWTTIASVTDNSADVTTLNVDGADQARVYRLKVNQSVQGSSNAAVRIYELELYAAETAVRDYDGIMTLDKTGPYQVSFMKGKNTLGAMTVKVVADKESLNTLIAKCDALNEEAYTPNSWAAFTEALNGFKAVAEEEYASQAAVDEAFIGLLQAKTALVPKAEKGVLALGVELAGQQDLTNCTPNSIDVLNAAVANAQQVLDDPNATQAEVDAASKALYEAITNLMDIADNTRLLQLIETAKKIDTSKYTQETVDALKEALKSAQQVADDKNATAQQIDDAYKALAKAIAELELGVNTSELENTIAIAENILANIDNYKPSTVTGLKAATEAAKAVLANQNATQEEVNKAAQDLAKVISEARVKAVKTEIIETVERANAIDTAQYTLESVRDLQAALEAAKAAIADEEIEQEAVDAANGALKQAINQLKPAKSDNGSTDNGSKPSDNSNNSSSGNSSTSKGDNASTGDHSNLMFAMLMLMLSCGAVLMLKLRKREQ